MDAVWFEKADIVTGRAYRRERDRITAAPAAYLNQRLEPTQLIEAAAEFFNFVLLMWLLKRKKFDGQVFALFMILYGIERYFIEYLRGDPGRGEVFGGAMSGTQLISIILVISGGLIWWFKSGVPKAVGKEALGT